MLSVIGTYDNGLLILDKDFTSKNPVKVIVTFLEDIKPKSDNKLFLNDFSFAKSKKNLEEFKGSFSDEVIYERRTDL